MVKPLYFNYERRWKGWKKCKIRNYVFYLTVSALLETNNEDKAKEIIRNAIKRIDKGSTSSSKDE